MIKSIFKTVLVLFTLFTVGCSKKDDDKIDYYLSQPRDTNLNGWWFRSDELKRGVIYGAVKWNGKWKAARISINN
jgi:hypothetical protein